MKRSVNNLKDNQPEMFSKRAEKKRVNLPWNHSLFFQVGLIVSLLIVFFIMESSIGYTPAKVGKYAKTTLEEPPFNVFTVAHDEPQPPKKKVVRQKSITNIAKPIFTALTVAPDNSNMVETNTSPTDGPVVSDPPIVAKPEVPVNTGPKNIMSVEFVPIFPGCESLATNKERVACMSSKIGAFVQRKFRTDKFDYLSSDNTHKVYVNLKIDSKGEITDIKARAANRDLEEEGKRVIGKLPKMKPGKQGDLNVDVLYTVPIVFRVD